MKLFEALGLSEGEDKVYTALIEIGPSSTGPVYKKAGVSQSKVYEILDRLKKKGLVSYIRSGGISIWQAASPALVLERFDKELESFKEKRELLGRELPRLLRNKEQKLEETQIYEGYNGFRNALFSLLDSLDKKHTLKVFGSPAPIPEPYYAFLKAYNNDRVKKGVNGRWLYGDALKQFAKKLYDQRSTEVRFIKGMTPASIAIGHDRILLMDFGDIPRTTVIMSRVHARNFGDFFDSLWQNAQQ